MKRTKKFLRRAVSAGRNAAQGITGTLVTTGGGALVGALANFANQSMRDESGNITTLGLWLPPAAGVLGGHFLKRTNANLGNGAIGAGGYILGSILTAYIQQWMQPKKTTQGLVEPNQARALREAYQAGASMAASRALPAARIDASAQAPVAGAPMARERKRFGAGAAATLG